MRTTREAWMMSLNFTRRPARRGSTAVVLVVTMTTWATAADVYVSPRGDPGNGGTRDAPRDLASALDGSREVKAGDSVLLLAGIYRRRPEADFTVRLVGTEAKPIQIRPAPGARATIDGGLVIQKPSAHLWIRDLEILVSENFSMPREIAESGSHPGSYGRPWGGLKMHGGTGCKYINLVIHDCAQGISSWVGAEDAEIYGCLIHENGWKAPDRGHGHSIYTQNRSGTKTIRHCILSAKYRGSYTLHAYGSSRAYVDNYLVEENIAYGLGPFLIGGGRPSRNIRVRDNILHGVDLRIGYNAPHNEDCEVRDNLVVGGSLTIRKFRDAVQEGNVVLERREELRERVVRWLPNRYDSNRAHLVVIEPRGQGRVEVTARPFLEKGNRFRLLDPRRFHGKPVHQGVCGGPTITVPLEGGDFRAFVVLKER